MEKTQHSIFFYESMFFERDAHLRDHYKKDSEARRLHQPFDYSVVRVYKPTSCESGLVERLGHSFIPHIRDQYAFRYTAKHNDIRDLYIDSESSEGFNAYYFRK